MNIFLGNLKEMVGADILISDADVLVNPVNCVGVMGKGLALAFRKKFPENYMAYKEYCFNKKLKVGKIFTFQEKGKWIINLATKNHWKDSSKLEWIEEGMDNLKAWLGHGECHSVAIPALGCGLGGLDWNMAREVIYRTVNDLPDVSFEVYPPQ